MQSPEAKIRYAQLDVLRGGAILGILLLNIVSFGLPSAAYLNPAWQGTPDLADTLDWLLLDLFAARKFLTLFALLFGAGLLFQLPRGPLWLSRRLLILMGFGLLHYLLLWQGDILLAYGIVGLCIGRNLAKASDNRRRLALGIGSYLFGTGLLLSYALLGLRSSEGRYSWFPGAVQIAQEQQIMLQGGWLGITDRAQQLLDSLVALATQYGWQLAGLMLIGAALTQNGWLTGQRSLDHYRRAAWWLLVPGFLLAAVASLSQWYLAWEYRFSHLLLQVPADLAAPLQTLGYVALFHRCWPRFKHSAIVAALARVGRMALSNYLLQTLLAIVLFRYYGQFMHFCRWQLSLLVPLFWAINLLFSQLWFRYYAQGPLEMLWRRLTKAWVTLSQ